MNMRGMLQQVGEELRLLRAQNKRLRKDLRRKEETIKRVLLILQR